MATIRIVTDTNSDLCAELREKYNIEYRLCVMDSGHQRIGCKNNRNRTPQTTPR